MSIFLRDPGNGGTAPVDARLAGAVGVDPNQLFRQTAWMRPAKGGMFANSTRPVCVGPKFSRFFAANYVPALHVAAAHGADVTLPLGLAANEGSWGQSRMARTQNNVFGAPPNGVDGVTYSSPTSAWQNWGRQWGKRIDGVGSDADLFLQRLAADNQHAAGAIDKRGPYNTQKTESHGDPDWMSKSRKTIDSVRKRLPFWFASGC